jgi:hypothetical protein
MYHHPYAEIALFSRTTAGVSALQDEYHKAAALPKKPPKVSKEDKLQKKEQMLNWARGMTLDNVVSNTKQDDVESLGPRKWCDLSAELKKEFIKKNKIQLSQAFRNAADLGKNVTNHMNTKSFKEQIKAPLKSKSPATKPLCITEDGTLFHIINTIIRNKECNTKTKNSHDREDQDSRNPKSKEYILS